MGLDAAVWDRRTRRLSWLGHQSTLPPPSVGCARRPPWTGQPPASWVFISVSRVVWPSDTRVSSGWLRGGESSRVALALGAEPPEDDLGLVDDEAVVVRRGQAWRGPGDTVDVRDRPTGPAHDVVVVVPDPRLVPRRRAGGLDATQQARRGERAQDVVDRLVGHRAEIGPDETDDRVRVEVGVVVHRRQHRETGTRHAQTGPAHAALEVGGRRHGCGVPR